LSLNLNKVQIDFYLIPHSCSFISSFRRIHEYKEKLAFGSASSKSFKNIYIKNTDAFAYYP
jgi:hypothetical protein